MQACPYCPYCPYCFHIRLIAPAQIYRIKLCSTRHENSYFSSDIEFSLIYGEGNTEPGFLKICFHNSIVRLGFLSKGSSFECSSTLLSSSGLKAAPINMLDQMTLCNVERDPHRFVYPQCSNAQIYGDVLLSACKLCSTKYGVACYWRPDETHRE